VAKRKSKPAGKKKFTNRPLGDLSKLKAQAAEQPEPAAVKPVAETPANPDDDENIFFNAMNGVAPLNNRPTSLPPEQPRPDRKTGDQQEAEEVMQTLRDLVDGEEPLSIHETDESIEGAVEGLDPRIIKKLRRGSFSIQDHLDLHGLNREEAKEKVVSFLQAAALQGKRCVLIIHGRGLGSQGKVPVLKNALRNWFTRRGLRKKILAFTTAREYDGGAGAIYVLLRKHKVQLPNR
jgi:DNA-nicking Smr family endonuclease